MITLHPGDCREVLATLPAASVQCVVTSPPYYGLRDYGTAQWDGGDAECDHAQKRNMGATTLRLDGREHLGAYDGEKATQIGMPFRDACGKCGATRIDRQIGLEPSPDEYLATMVAVFREVRRVLRDDGTCWVNMGDSYSSGSGGDKRMGDPFDAKAGGAAQWRSAARPQVGAKPKDLLMMPARLALALQADGWWLRSDIIWHKPNPMPESVTDRPTSAHEHVFLLTKRATYYYDADAVREPHTNGDYWIGRAPTQVSKGNGDRNDAGGRAVSGDASGRNLRNVWTIATAPYAEAHFATFPPALAERCIKAGSRPGDTILDPFAGAGTTLLVADRLQRNAIGIELNPAYTRLAMQRCHDDAPLFTSWPPADDPADARMADLFATRAAAD
jgi:DNA modification methylase